MVSWIGGNQRSLEYERQARFAGMTKCPLRKMVPFAVDAVTSFSTKPLRVAVWLGLAVSLLAFWLLFYVLYRWAINDVIPGWASPAFAQALFAGTQLLVLGIMGEYLGRLVEDQRRRPLWMVDSVVSQAPAVELSSHKIDVSAVGPAPPSRTRLLLKCPFLRRSDGRCMVRRFCSASRVTRIGLLKPAKLALWGPSVPAWTSLYFLS
jgi:polyisoprenyl-phosphate glycosyltransferase